MAEEKKQGENKERIICPNCGKPVGEGECQRCINYRMVVKLYGSVMVMT
jgi:hypothetical protein